MRIDEIIMVAVAVGAVCFVIGVIAGSLFPNPATDSGDMAAAVDRLAEAECRYRKHLQHFTQDHDGTRRALAELRAAIENVRRVQQSLVIT